MSILTRISGFQKNKKSLGSNADNALVPFAYNAASFQYLGRWVDTGSGKYSGWGGSSVVFQIFGTGILNIEMPIVDNTASGLCSLQFYFDGQPYVAETVSITSASTLFTGTKYLTIPIPNDNLTHTVEIFCNEIGSDQFNLDTQQTFQAYTTGSAAIINTWTQGANVIQCLGDSWMVGSSSWVKQLDRNYFSVYVIANNGYTSADLLANYNYSYSGQIAPADTTPVAAIISGGVNDFNQGITTAQFQTNYLAIIDSVRVRFPALKIILIGVPSNGASLYAQYRPNMSAIAAGLRTNVLWCDESSLDAAALWVDAYHLTPPSLVTRAAFIDNWLRTTGGL